MKESEPNFEREEESEGDVIEETIEAPEKRLDENVIAEQEEEDEKELAELREQLEDNDIQEAQIEYISREEFDSQFEQSEQFDLDGEDTEITSISPEKPISNEWVVIVGGWATGKTAYMDEMYEIAKSGRKVLFLNPDHGLAPDDDDAEYYKDRSVARTIAQKAAAVQEVLEQKGIVDADIVGHSQGAQVAVAMGVRHPELVRRIVLDSPAGLIGEDTRTKLSTRAMAQATEEGMRTPGRMREANRLEREGHIEKGSWKPGRSYVRERLAQGLSMLKNPFFRNITETGGIAATDISPLLRDLKEYNDSNERRIEIVLLTAESDRIIPERRIEHTLEYEDPVYSEVTRTYEKSAEEYEKPFELVDRWAMYSNKGASHNAPYLELPGTLAHILGSSEVDYSKEKESE